ncbi:MULTISPECIES: sigma-54-dependent transcriptional regulator [unclassified Psychrobacter]|uniref:sigma-54-dependent transcriptional regulator n=2 Tax=Psychrobacter TaxID=497 RepID=UPI003F45987E
MTAIALVVDDEVDLCRLMQITLTKMGIKSDVAYSLSQAKSYLENNHYDFCLTDLQLPDGSGLELVKQISSSSNTPVAVITAHGSMDLAIEALKIGAFDFVNKPLELPRLRQLVENALKVIHQDESVQATDEITPEQQLLDSRLIGNSTVMQTLKTTIIKLARSQAPVFLSGASGTGKEVVARLIHDLSPRRDGSFVPVNCGAIPSELMESEFFGHKKGSFTGAVADKQGLFQQASGGTLFLDEVADLPLAMQVKLLRAIQEKTVRAIGDTKEVPVDIRILSATHKDLSQLVKDGEFRQDLYYRINVIELKLPTLNTRRDDIPLLAKHFLALISEEWQLGTPAELTESACERLQQHEFAGNVRELRNILERAITLAETTMINDTHLGLPKLNDSDTVGSKEMAEREDINTVSTINDEPMILQVDGPKQSIKNDNSGHLSNNLHPYRTHSQRYSSAFQMSTTKSDSVNTSSVYNQDRRKPDQFVDDIHTQPSLVSISEAELPQKGLEAYLQEQEKRLIIKALNQTDGNKTQAAELLGTTFRSLRYRMKKLEIDEE